MVSTIPKTRNAEVNRGLEMLLSIHVLLSHKSSLFFKRSVSDLYLSTIISRQNLNWGLIIAGSSPYLGPRGGQTLQPRRPSRTLHLTGML
jgi:hypothetical protein